MKRGVIAEIGINHDGNMEIAWELIQAASRSGCGGIKFQYRNLNNSYFAKGTEIGDEIIQAEIQRAYLSPLQIGELTKRAKELKLEVGISFFTTEDLIDFPDFAREFDFFKIPSAELMNLELISLLLQTNKMLYLSVGMHTESEIETVFSKISEFENWTPMQCVSNYPVSIHNTSLGYIKYLAEKWNRPVGYSSHDDYWENCILAMSLGATIIERHITLGKELAGLDHSSSSTESEFTRLNKIIENYPLIVSGNSQRVPNQGELLNRQNLGRSYYAKREIEPNSLVKYEDFAYRSPFTGIGIEEFQSYLNKKIKVKLKKGDVLTKEHFLEKEFLNSKKDIDFARRNRISIPVRLSDYDEIRASIPIGHYEFHLSYTEAGSDLKSFDFNSEDTFSIHLPDYLDPNTLIDPWSENSEVRKASVLCVKNINDFASRIAESTGKSVPIVASLAGIGQSRERYFQNASQFLSEFSSESSTLTLQWLPPFAWYFGGSIPLNILNNLDDIGKIIELNIPITMDTSHLLLGANAFGFNPTEVISSLEKNIKHIHISDALGIDGEGAQIGAGGIRNFELIQNTINFNSLKVIEVWQGHLNNYRGFKEAIKIISNPSMTEEK